MTSFQALLIDLITTKTPGKYRATRASFNGRFLNCEADVEAANGKIKKQKFSFVFDSAEDCQGCRLCGKPSGTYAIHFANDVFDAIVEYSNEIAKHCV